MTLKEYRLTRKPVQIKRTKRIFFKKVQILLQDMPIRYFLQLDSVIDVPDTEHVAIGIFMDIDPSRIDRLPADRMIAVYNHVKAQVEKCRKLFLETKRHLLDIDDGVDKSHFEDIGIMLLIYEVAGGDIFKMGDVEKLTFSRIVNWLNVKNAYIRLEQNRYLKFKQNDKQ
jgi:hypothetical protein